MQVSAGRHDKQDVQVRITSGDLPLVVDITSPVNKLFGDSIRFTAEEVLRERGLQTGEVLITDNQALDLVLRARLKTACDRFEAALREDL